MRRNDISLSIKLPARGSPAGDLLAVGAARFPDTEAAGLQPRRLRRRARRRRPARRRRTRGSRRRSTGTRRSRSAAISGRSDSASPRRWTRRSAAWGSTGRLRSSSIRRSIDAARDFPGAFLASGAGTDHLPPGPKVTVDDVIAAYEQQFAAVEGVGGRIIMMASRALAACARSPDDYSPRLLRSCSSRPRSR